MDLDKKFSLKIRITLAAVLFSLLLFSSASVLALSSSGFSFDKSLKINYTVATYTLCSGSDFNEALTNNCTDCKEIIFDYTHNQPGIMAKVDAGTITGINVDEAGVGNIQLYYDDTTDTAYVLSVDFIQANADCIFMFKDLKSLIKIEFNNFKTSNTTKMNFMFQNCIKLEDFSLSGFDTSKVTEMTGMFNGCSGFKTITIPETFSIKEVMFVRHMFSGCSNLEILTLPTSFKTNKVLDVRYMFYNCTALKYLDISNFNTDKVNTALGMFQGCSALKTLDLSNFTLTNAYDLSYMFHECVELESITWPINVTTADNIDLHYMFRECKKLKEIDLSNFTLTNISDLSYMFAECVALESIIWPGNVTTADNVNLSDMFNKCEKLKEIDLSNFTLTNVLYLSNMFTECVELESIIWPGNVTTADNVNLLLMFYNCKKLDEINLSNFTLTNVSDIRDMFRDCIQLDSIIMPKSVTIADYADLSGMFYNCSDLDNVDLSNFTLNNVSNMRYMFYNCSNLESITWPESVITVDKADLNSMFASCEKLDEIDLSNFTLTNVSDLSNMFSDCVELESITWPESVATADNTIFSYMFSRCSALESLDLSGFDTSKVTNMNGMFFNCSNLDSLDLSSFDTRRVTSMNNMFDYCSKLDSLDLSSFDTRSVTNMTYMFIFCSNLTTIYVGDLFNTEAVTSSTNMFYGCTSLVGGAGTAYVNAGVTDATYAHIDGGLSNPGYFTGKVVLKAGTDFNNLIPSNCTEIIFDAHTSDYDSIIISATKSDSAAADDSNFIKYYIVGTKMYVLSKGYEILANENCSSMFREKSNLISIQFNNFNTSNTINMSSMFYGCSGLTTINLSNFNTSKVKAMDSMFRFCTNLTSINLSSFKTDGVEQMSDMFSFCSSLSAIYVNENWSTASVDFGSGMFSYCYLLFGGLGTKYSSSNHYYNYARIDGGPTSSTPGYLTDINSNFVYPGSTINTLTNCYDRAETIVFDYTSNVPVDDLTNIIPVGFNNQIPITYYGYDEINNISYIYSDLEIVANYSCSSMFSSCNSLIEVKFNNFNTNKVISMASMFYSCSNLKKVNINNLNTGNVEDMSSLFYNCSSIEELDMSNMNVLKVINMSGMFNSCYVLESLNLSGFNTRDVTNMSKMFTWCYKLESLNLSSFDTRNVTDMHSMFWQCSSLEFLDLSNFDTRNVTDMQWMFMNCESLEFLNISSFNTINVTDMNHMFNYMENLVTIFVGDNWSTSSVTYSEGMFYKCEKLVGGEGTIYKDTNLIDMTYAHIDGGSANPGYFTHYLSEYMFAGNYISSLTNKYDGAETIVFDYTINVPTENLINIKEIGFNNGVSTIFYGYDQTNSVAYIYSDYEIKLHFNCQDMFSQCSSITEIKFININTSKVIYMQSMFKECNNLQSIDLINFNTENVIDMSSMFQSCDSLTTLDLSSFNTSSVTDMRYMFYSCNELTTLDLSSFNTSSVTDMSNMFFNCEQLKSLDLSHFNTENVITMNNMFAWCYMLQSLNLSSFDTRNVTYMDSMFWCCYSLEVLDLSSFSTDSLISMGLMFASCTKLKTIYVSDLWNLNDINIGPDMFNGCENLIGGAGTAYVNAGVTDATYAHIDEGSSNPGYFTGKAILKTGTDFNSLIPADCTEVVFDKYSSSYDYIIASASSIGNASINSSEYAKYYIYGSTMYVIADVGYEIFANEDCSNMFKEKSTLTSIQFNNFNTSEVTDMNSMFYECRGLTELYLHEFETKNVTDISYMFYGCDWLTELDLSNFDTSKVTDMSYMFHINLRLKTICVSNLWVVTTEALNNSTAMFAACTALIGEKGTKYNGAYVPDASYARIDGGPSSSTPGYFTYKAAPVG